MKSRIFISILSLSIAVLSLVGCSENGKESVVDTPHNSVTSTSDDGNNNYSISENPTNSIVDSDSDRVSESDSGSNSESVQPTGTPTIFIGPDGIPIYDSEVTKIDGSDKKAAELTAEDEGVTIFCEGFQYFKEPEGVAYSSYENPEMFDGWVFKGETPTSKNAWKRVNIGDEICGLTLKSATSTFLNYIEISFDYYQTYYTQGVADFNLFAEFDGSVTLTGYLNSSNRTSYEPDGGELRFTPAEDKLPIMCTDMFKIQPETYSLAMSYGAGEMFVFNEINEIGIDNPSGLDLGCIGIGDTAFVRLTLSDIKYGINGYVNATLVDIEVLSDVLAHEEDTI